MTLLDLIRTLHAEGQPVLAYDLYTCDNGALDMESVIDRTPGYVTAAQIISPMIPPQYIELGEKPRSLYVGSLEEYLRVTHTKATAGNLPKRFPRLLVAIFTDRSEGFYQRYLGKSWRDIPPIEIEWANSDGLLLPLLDAKGIVTGFSYDGESGVDTGATYYTVRSDYGSDFGWQGDPSRDPLPEGLDLRIVGD